MKKIALAIAATSIVGLTTSAQAAAATSARRADGL